MEFRHEVRTLPSKRLILVRQHKGFLQQEELRGKEWQVEDYLGDKFLGKGICLQSGEESH